MRILSTGICTSETYDPGILQVVLMGIGVVFAGLLLIMLICKLMSVFGSARGKTADEKEKTQEKDEEIKPDGELAAVIGAAVAEDLGTDVSAIKIISVKKVAK